MPGGSVAGFDFEFSFGAAVECGGAFASPLLASTAPQPAKAAIAVSARIDFINMHHSNGRHRQQSIRCESTRAAGISISSERLNRSRLTGIGRLRTPPKTV